MSREAYICDALRTPIGRFGGVLAEMRADDLAAIPIQALIARHQGLAEAVEEVILGCANQAGEDNRNVARMAALLAGLPASVPGTTMNRLCASGLDAVGTAARAIRAGELDVAIAGGVESMTRAPLVMAKAEAAFQRSAEIHDTTIGWRFVNPLMQAQYGVDSMPETAENVADEYQITRADQDAFALRSQQRARDAKAGGALTDRIVAVATPGSRKSGPVTVSTDEHPRPETTVATLAKLRPIVRADGTVTAGNSSGINDGAQALLIASGEAVERLRLTPLARIAGMATAGVPPRVMGIGPVPATQKLTRRLGLGIADFDLIELNEAFASQSLACLREFDLPDDAGHVNPNGGAIAYGHPLGMSGARLAADVAIELNRRGGRWGLATMCVGVGQGVALVLERMA